MLRLLRQLNSHTKFFLPARHKRIVDVSSAVLRDCLKEHHQQKIQILGREQEKCACSDAQARAASVYKKAVSNNHH